MAAQSICGGNLYKIIRKIPLLASLLAGLAGCAAIPHDDHLTQDQPVADAVTAEAEGPLPAVPLDEQTLFKLLTAELSMQRQQFTVATQLYMELATQTRDPRLAEQAARIALFTRNDAAALKMSELWVELAPDSIAAHEAVTSAYIRNGMTEEVQPHLDYLLARSNSGSSRGFQFIAALLQQEQDLQTALQIMEKFVDRHQGDAEAYYALSYVAMHAKELDKSRAAIEKALALKPDWYPAMNHYARIMRMQGNPYEAEVYLAGALKKYPRAIELRLNYARLLVENRQLDEALEQYKQIVAAQPDDEDTVYITAVLALQLNKLKLARHNFQHLLDLGLRVDVANYYLGEIAAVEKKDDEAITHFDAVVAGEHLLDARLKGAVIKARNGQVLQAREMLEILRSRFPASQTKIIQVEGMVLEDAGQIEQARAVFDRAIEEQPENVELLYSRAMLAEKQADLTQVEADLRKILQIQPDNANVLNALGYTLANNTQRYDEAYDYIKKALDLSPDSNAILDSMGWVLYRLGRLDEAATYLRRSLAIKNDHEVAAHLGEVMWMLGDQDGAREIWEEALESFPDDKLILDVMKRFIH